MLTALRPARLIKTRSLLAHLQQQYIHSQSTFAMAPPFTNPHVEASVKRVRVRFGGQAIADTSKAKLVYVVLRWTEFLQWILIQVILVGKSRNILGISFRSRTCKINSCAKSRPTTRTQIQSSSMLLYQTRSHPGRLSCTPADHFPG